MISNKDRKGELYDKFLLENHHLNKIFILEKKLGKLEELRKFQNGTIGAFFSSGQHRFISGSKKYSKNINNSLVKSHQGGVSKKIVSLKTAVKLLKKYNLEQNGGNIIQNKKPISLKIAVNLLKNYYSDNNL